MKHELAIQWNRHKVLQSIVMPRPSNFHAHFRRDALMRAVARHIMAHVRYVLSMPNTGPILTIEQAEAYYEELMAIALVEIDHEIDFIMTLYHTALITPKVIEQIALSRVVRAVKNYPAHKGATTGSGEGIPFDECDPDVIRAMIEFRVPLLGHFEDVYDKNGRELPHSEREAHCVEHRLWRFRDKYPDLRICFEHASTKEAIKFVKADTSGNTVMTVTPQHMLFTNKDLERYSWRKHLKCMPIVKSEEERDAILSFAITGDPRVIAGDDTAPHPSALKNKSFDECASGCWLPHSIALYALAFMSKRALNDNFVRFMCLNGPSWWNLPEVDSEDTITIRVEDEKDIPDPVAIPSMNDVVIPLGWTEELDRLPVGYAVV